MGRRKDAFDDILFHVFCPSPKLTWKDVQYLIAKAAKIQEPGWNINAVGDHIHHRYCDIMQTLNGFERKHVVSSFGSHMTRKYVTHVRETYM